MERSYKFFHAFYPEKNGFLSSERSHRTHIIFLTWRLSKTLQKPFLQNSHVVIKIHLPLPLEYKVMVSSIKRETTLLLHYTGKNKLNNTAIFENSAGRTLHLAVTSRWPDTSDSRAHEFMTPSWSHFIPWLVRSTADHSSQNKIYGKP